MIDIPSIVLEVDQTVTTHYENVWSDTACWCATIAIISICTFLSIWAFCHYRRWGR